MASSVSNTCFRGFIVSRGEDFPIPSLPQHSYNPQEEKTYLDTSIVFISCVTFFLLPPFLPPCQVFGRLSRFERRPDSRKPKKRVGGDGAGAMPSQEDAWGFLSFTAWSDTRINGQLGFNLQKLIVPPNKFT